jgi:triacylglycerol lipase
MLSFITKSHWKKKISICGHSLGGAMATIAASRLHNVEKVVTLYTFGSPRVGNAEFVRLMSGVTHYRFVNNNDLVTTIPLWIMGYRHHGQVMYFNFNGIFKNLAWWRKLKDKFRGKWAALRKGQPFDGLMDHSMENYTKYTKDNK